MALPIKQQEPVKALIVGVGHQGCMMLLKLKSNDEGLSVAYIDVDLPRPEHPEIPLDSRVACRLWWSTQRLPSGADTLDVYWRVHEPETERHKIRSLLQDINLLILVVGNDNGSGVVFEVARIARSMAITTIGVVCDTVYPVADLFEETGMAAAPFDQLVTCILDYNAVHPEEIRRIFRHYPAGGWA